MDEWEYEFERLAAEVAQIKQQVDHIATAQEDFRVPGLAEWIIGDQYMARPTIYPRQLTALRVMFCEIEALTAYDYMVLAEWQSGFEKRPYEPGSPSWMYEPTPDRDYVMGTPPDVLARMAEMRRQGRRWFREVNLVMGRRGSKGHLGAEMCARHVWETLALGDPQQHFGMARSKRIVIPIFAGNKEQARFNLFADVATAIVEAPCFAPYIVDLYKDKLILATPADLARPDRVFPGSIEIVAKEATGNAGRGPGTTSQWYDEMAFIEPNHSAASAEEVYAAATPALDQFGEFALLAELSSPYQMTGEFYAIHARARELNPRTGTAAYPEIFTLQVPAWEMYRDWKEADNTPMVTEAEAATSPALRDVDGNARCFPKIRRPMSVYDEQMKQEERKDPRVFNRERRAQWGTVSNPYLDPATIGPIFGQFEGKVLRPTEHGALGTSYTIAVDPAAVHDAFAWSVGHALEPDERGLPHVVIDLSRRYLPIPGEALDIPAVLDQLEADIREFRAVDVITDQYGGQFVVQDLNRRLYGKPFFPMSVVRELARNHDRNLDTAAAFREAVTLGQVHCYPEAQLERELRALQEVSGRVAAPTSGPTVHDDQAVTAMVLTEQLLKQAGDRSVKKALSDTTAGGLRGHVGQELSEQDKAFSAAGKRRGPKVGERASPTGPKRLPPWAS